MQCGFAVGLFPFSLWSVSHSEMRLHSVHFYFFHFLHIHSRKTLCQRPLFEGHSRLEFVLLFSPFLLSFVFPFCRNLSRTSQTLLPRTFPRIEDSTQLPISTDASYSTVTNGMWASCPSCPPPVLSEWVDPPLHDIVMMRALMGLYVWNVSQCLGLVYEDDCLPFILFPLVLFYVLFLFCSQVCVL